ncbi:MAG: Hsp70 family protein, partial [Myxococcaceae bacterium]
IGIDLGTTNSCVALLNGTRPLVLRSREGYNTLPSVVSLTQAKKLLVSHRAKSQMVLNPQHTIYGAKRLVGRMYDSATVRQVRERFHYEILPDASGRAAVRLGDNILSLEEVQGLILKECKEMAEQHLNQAVHRAVITVPAYYSEPQREAVRKAGAMAGLRVERILNEPTAAALAYGLNRELKKRVLVYDLGGGTFDATLLRIDKNVFEVLATAGDVFLGGLDFDNQLVDFLLQRFQETEKIAFSGDSVALSRVADAAERLKIGLSERTTFDVHIPMLMMDDTGKPKDLRTSVTREELEKICGSLVNRTLDVVRDVLLDAKLKTSDVDEIILVGGQSRMPLVRDKIKDLFGKAPHASVNADEAVALGAALYSGSVDKVSSVVLIDVLPMTIGVAMPGGAFKRVIERNTALPVQKSFGLATSRDNETVLELNVFQGEDGLVSSNEYLGTVRVEDLPKAPKGAVKLAVTLKVDSECVLHIEARELTTRKEVRATLGTRYTPEALNQKLNISAAAIAAAEEKRGQELKERGGRFWGFVKKVFRR